MEPAAATVVTFKSHMLHVYTTSARATVVNKATFKQWLEAETAPSIEHFFILYEHMHLFEHFYILPLGIHRECKLKHNLSLEHIKEEAPQCFHVFLFRLV